ncbi:hypothetical protein COT77_02135 [Candidatus Berkelbacteria bacterium CG10_big_fil_rev_8_21_14_0_10_41_12]|uniref:Uncharacterized protein n=1 Tax=Candidatus Berkelbacteria bacterium CG10_big_fil_rev_8_21_14_0_10_41_12 TaxID=1974513 RepID=A0A2M6WX33_9BACT|nr:MAG: hypothetical protein COT77_02135 [Candidatus Berkelbacteria bacterium CG10_big_fil_rev_8_21_14_0_10_41_12]
MNKQDWQDYRLIRRQDKQGIRRAFILLAMIVFGLFSLFMEIYWPDIEAFTRPWLQSHLDLVKSILCLVFLVTGVCTSLAIAIRITKKYQL